MSRGGKREGAGRPAGAVTRRTREIADRALAEGISPLEVMLSTMRWLYGEKKRTEACAIAKDAAPYLHPRLSSIEATGKDGKDLVPAERSLTETARQLAWLLTLGAHEAGK